MSTDTRPTRSALVGESEHIRELLRRIDSLASCSSPIMLLGETGTGKEMVARALHGQGPRAHQPFIAVNCGALNREVLESELFGHVAGAYSGALGDRPGCFEEASGGTLLLDEIGDAPLEVQVRLLRVLQEHQVTRLGSSKPIPVDARVIVATHHDLPREVAEGRFRRDLYHRLHVGVIELLPLRKRMEDLDSLLRHFLAKHGPPGVQVSLSEEALAALRSYHYPGNVRELGAIIEGATAELAGAGPIELAALRLEKPVAPEVPATIPLPPAPEGVPWDEIVRRIAKEHSGLGWAGIKEMLFQAAVRQCSGNESAAAKMLGVHRSTVGRHRGSEPGLPKAPRSRRGGGAARGRGGRADS